MPNIKQLLRQLFIRRSSNFFVQLTRYFFVGGLAFAVDFGALAFFTEICRFHYLLSNTIAFIFGLLANYFISIFWVFTNSNLKSRKVEFILFAAIGVIGLGLNDLLLWIFTQGLAVYYLLSKILAAAICCLWNFFARKYLLFNKKSNEG
jgi:putative flippase GtrA